MPTAPTHSARLPASGVAIHTQNRSKSHSNSGVAIHAQNRSQSHSTLVDGRRLHAFIALVLGSACLVAGGMVGCDAGGGHGSAPARDRWWYGLYEVVRRGAVPPGNRWYGGTGPFRAVPRITGGTD